MGGGYSTKTENEVSLDFRTTPDDIKPRHFVFIVSGVDLHKRGKCELATLFLTTNEALMFKSKKLSIDLFCKPKPISPFIYKVFTHNSRIKSNRIKSNILQIRYKHKQDCLINQNEHIIIMKSYCYSIADSISDFPAFTNYAMSFLAIENNISKLNHLLSNYIVYRHHLR